MDTKEQLISTIKEWVKYDNEIRVLQKELTARKNEKKKNSAMLMNIMKEHKIDCFDINNGQIMYNQKNVKKPITKKILFQLLSNYFKGDTLKATDINEYILSNREEIVKEEIVRVFT